MKRTLPVTLLAFAMALYVPMELAAQTQNANTPTSQKVIKDPSEYNAYITALNTQDPAAKAAAMEAFIRQYPQSIVFTEALEQAMAAYQQAGNSAGVLDSAKRLLGITPDNVRALAVVVYLDRTKATAGSDSAALAEGCRDAQTGLIALPSWSKPADMSDADFAKLREQMSDIFYGALGFCALQKRDYATARENYEKAVATDPNSMQDVYQLAVADLEQNPMDANGLWYCGKALQLAGNNSATVNAITPYCKAKYRKYHGSEDGWDQLLASAAGQQALPAGFAASIKRAPTPCEIAVQAVAQNDASAFSFSDREFILSQAGCSAENKAAADKVWQSLRDLEKNGQAKLRLPSVKVIASTSNSIDAAITDENKEANRADIHVTMEKPMATPPAPGATIDIIGVLASYTPEPFLFTMEKGQLP